MNHETGGIGFHDVLESEATAPIHDVYEELMRLCRVPMVAQVFRRLASDEDEFFACWQTLRPLLADGALQRSADELTAAGLVMPSAPLVPELLRSVGLRDQDVVAIRNALEAYNRANAINLLCVQVLLGGGGVLRPAPARDGEGDWAPLPLGPLPPLLDPANLTDDHRGLLRILSNVVNGNSEVRPTLYRHLMHWPPFLALAAVLLHSHVPAIRSAASRVEARAKVAVGDWQPQAVSPTNVAPKTDGKTLELLAQFSPRISEMLVIGHLLRRCLALNGESED